MSLLSRLIRVLLQAIGLLTLVSIALIAVLVPYLGPWLQPQDKPEKSDFIVVLAGNANRCIRAAEVYKEGWAPLVMVSQEYIGPPGRREKLLAEMGYPEPDPNVLCLRILERLGVPDRAIKSFGTGSISTAEEAASLKVAVGDRRAKAIVVTAPFQARRAKIIFESALPEDTFLILSPTDRKIEARWWRDKQSALDASIEMIKIAYFEIGGEFRAPSK